MMDLRDGKFGIIGWPPEEDRKVSEAIYLMEQDRVFGTYQNDRERFLQDWKNGEWEPAGTIAFPKRSVEIIERINDNS